MNSIFQFFDNNISLSDYSVNIIILLDNIISIVFQIGKLLFLSAYLLSELLSLYLSAAGWLSELIYLANPLLKFVLQLLYFLAISFRGSFILFIIHD